MKIIEEGDILVSIDVSGLYTNIPQSEGLEAVSDALEERNDKRIPSDYIVKLLELVLKNNIFEFNRELFIQMIGTAMGTKPAPSYANIFMARKIDSKIGELSNSVDEENPVKFFKRFLDDIFMLFRGYKSDCEQFVSWLNNLMFGVIRFTFKFVYNKVEFLYLEFLVKNRRLETNLYIKPTNKQLYLSFDSNHPEHCKRGIPYSQSLRVVERCTSSSDRDKHLENPKENWLKESILTI